MEMRAPLARTVELLVMVTKQKNRTVLMKLAMIRQNRTKMEPEKEEVERPEMSSKPMVPTEMKASFFWGFSFLALFCYENI